MLGTDRILEYLETEYQAELRQGNRLGGDRVQAGWRQVTRLGRNRAPD